MMTVNSDYTGEAFDLMSTPEHFSNEGYDAEDQPGVIEAVTSWMLTGPGVIEVLKNKMIEAQYRKNGKLLPVSDEPGEALRASDEKVPPSINLALAHGTEE